MYVMIDERLRLAWELSQALRKACLGRRHPKAPRFGPFYTRAFSLGSNYERLTKAAAALGGLEGWSKEADRLRGREDAALEAAGFEREVETDLWAKGGVCYGREAALQTQRSWPRRLA